MANPNEYSGSMIFPGDEDYDDDDFPNILRSPTDDEWSISSLDSDTESEDNELRILNGSRNSHAIPMLLVYTSDSGDNDEESG
jgi:hypothetical protein